MYFLTFSAYSFRCVCPSTLPVLVVLALVEVPEILAPVLAVVVIRILAKARLL